MKSLEELRVIRFDLGNYTFKRPANAHPTLRPGFRFWLVIKLWPTYELKIFLFALQLLWYALTIKGCGAPWGIYEIVRQQYSQHSRTIPNEVALSSRDLQLLDHTSTRFVVLTAPSGSTYEAFQKSPRYSLSKYLTHFLKSPLWCCANHDDVVSPRHEKTDSYSVLLIM